MAYVSIEPASPTQLASPETTWLRFLFRRDAVSWTVVSFLYERSPYSSVSNVAILFGLNRVSPSSVMSTSTPGCPLCGLVESPASSVSCKAAYARSTRDQRVALSVLDDAPPLPACSGLCVFRSRLRIRRRCLDPWSAVVFVALICRCASESSERQRGEGGDHRTMYLWHCSPHPPLFRCRLRWSGNRP